MSWVAGVLLPLPSFSLLQWESTLGVLVFWEQRVLIRLL